MRTNSPSPRQKTHRLSFTCHSQQSRSFPNLHKGLFPNRQKPPQPKQRVKPGAHTPLYTHPGRCPGGNPLPVRAPHARPRCRHRPARLRCPGNGRAPPLPLAPPLRDGEEEAPPTQGCVCGAVPGADRAHLAGSGSRWGTVPGGSSECGCGGPAASPALPPPPLPEPLLPGGRE